MHVVTGTLACSHCQTAHLMTAHQVARMLSISQRTVWRLASRGVLPKPIAIGGSTRWRRADVERWLNPGEEAVAASAERKPSGTRGITRRP